MEMLASKQQQTTTKPKNTAKTNKLLKPVGDYTSRFQYNGYLKNSRWRYFDEMAQSQEAAATELQMKYRMRKKQKFCILMGFAGGNYYGMQYNNTCMTIEDKLLNAMVKNEWILEEHINKSWMFEFSHGSRTDRGVSAARMNVSALLRRFNLEI